MKLVTNIPPAGITKKCCHLQPMYLHVTNRHQLKGALAVKGCIETRYACVVLVRNVKGERLQEWLHERRKGKIVKCNAVYCGEVERASVC
jgi:hypothetical protein